MTDAMLRLSAALADRYRIERELGQGGMATVYLAEDLKHDRQVAIKVLRPELAAVIGADRFLSEIKTTANLQHPHILPLFDSGEADSFLFYVMPYIEGETLRDRLNREKQLPIADAVRLTSEVAAALDYAHRRNVIHRDIKPENILLHDGSALVADFGIALAASKAGGTRMTETGMSLGTPHYMSPEQAMGEREITARSDVYALGCVLYEMLTGDPPFTGSTAQAIVARVVTESPRPMVAQRHTIPPPVEGAVLTALEKLPADRFATAAEFAAALADPGYQPKTGALPPPAAVGPSGAGGWRHYVRDPVTLLLAAVAVGSLAAVSYLARRTEAPVARPVRFVMATSDSTKPIDFYPWPAAISPDGGMVVYSVQQTASHTGFYLLRTDQLEAQPLPGTTDAYQPFFSPDGQWLAFEMDGKERKLRLDGSAPVTITDASGANGADWMVGDEIVLGAQGTFHGLTHVSAAGGEAVALTQPDTAKGEIDHLWPIGLPDGKTIAFTIWTGTLATSRLALTSLDDGRVVPLDIAGIRPLAVVDGVLIYVQADGAVMAVALDSGKKRLTGRPIPVHDPIPVASANNGNAGIFVSPGGALVTSRGGTIGTLSWVSRNGHTEPVLAQARSFSYPRLSPDQRLIAVVADNDVWIFDRSLSTFTRLTSLGTVTSVEWSADGSQVLYTAASTEARGAVWLQSPSGGAQARQIFATPALTPGAALSTDGKSLLINSLRESSWDIRRVTLDSTPVVHDYLDAKAQENAAQFSPDDRWVALASDESGRNEVYVRSFPDPSARIQVSVTGGSEPTWSRDGRTLYYRSGTALLAARISLSPTFALLGRDTVLTSGLPANTAFFGATYDVAQDGQRVLTMISDANDFQLIVSPNWIVELRRRLAQSGGKR